MVRLGWLQAVVLAVALVSFSGTPAPAEDAKKTETKFEEFSPDGKFSILMPGKPKDNSQKNNGLEINIWVVEGASGAYLVSSTALPVAANATEEVIANTLDSSATGQVKGMGGKEIKRREVKLAKKYTGLEVQAEMPKGPQAPNGGKSISRLFLIDGKLYQILALGEKEFVEGKEVTKFLDSFKILNAK